MKKYLIFIVLAILLSAQSVSAAVGEVTKFHFSLEVSSGVDTTVSLYDFDIDELDLYAPTHSGFPNLPEGIYDITVNVKWEQNNSGQRIAQLYVIEDNPFYAGLTLPAAQGRATEQSFSYLAISSGTGFTVLIRQNSGITLLAEGVVSVVQVK